MATITNLNQLDFDTIYTYADYLKWQIDERIELIKGFIHKMSAPARVHQRVSVRLERALDRYLENKPCEWYHAPFDVRLPRKADGKANKQIYTVVQPDICVICDEKKLDKRGCLGAPDLIVEILSPGNTKKEMKDKFEVYEESGVREYWIVEPTEKIVLVYTLNAEGIFIGHRPRTEDEVLTSHIFPELKVNLIDVFKD